jgi:hypothetical protein
LSSHVTGLSPPDKSIKREQIVEDFLSSADAEKLTPMEGRYCARLIVDYGCDWDAGQPLRVSPAKMETFLLSWLPGHVVLKDDGKAAMPT